MLRALEKLMSLILFEIMTTFFKKYDLDCILGGDVTGNDCARNKCPVIHFGEGI